MHKNGKYFAIVNSRIKPHRKTDIFSFFSMYNIPWIETAFEGQATELVKKSDAHTIIVAGGDGTVHEIVNGMNLDKQKILIVPAGSLNSLARQLGLRSRGEAFALVKENAVDHRIDLIHARIHNSDNTATDSKIVGFASAGFDGKVAGNAHKMRHIYSPLRFIAAGWAATTMIRKVKAEFRINGNDLSSKYFTSFLINNGGANMFSTVKRWNMNDGMCEVKFVNMPLCTHVVYAMISRTALNGRYIKGVRKIDIKYEQPVDMMVDGEVFENVISFEAEVLPKALQIILPVHGKVHR